MKFSGRSNRAAFRASFVALLLLVLSGLKGQAAELQLGVNSQYVYNSNFFANAGNTNAVNSLQFGPSIRLSDTAGRFEYDLSYLGGYQGYVDQSGINAWESRARGRLSYEIDRRTTLRITDRFRDISNLRFSRQDIELADTALDPNQDRYFRNDLELEVIRDLTRLFELRVRTAHHWIDFDKNVDRNDSQAFEFGAEVNAQVATTHRVGLGVEYTYQKFERAFSRLGSVGEYVTAYLAWTWAITDALQLRVSGGPAWIRSDESKTKSVSQTRFVGGRLNGESVRARFTDCITTAMPTVASDCSIGPGSTPIPGLDLGPVESFMLASTGRVGRASETTFFGGASLQGRVAEWVLQASYSRRQSTTSGDGLASSLDRVAIDIEFDHPNTRWSPFVAGSWDRRQTLTKATFVDFTVISGANLEAVRTAAIARVEESQSRRDNFTAIAGLRGALDRNWSGTVEFRYRRTESRDRGISRPGVDTFFVLFTVDYAFDLIRI